MPLPLALFKQSPEDFVVDEVDAYPATGDGPHVLVRIRKRGLNTEQAIARVCEALGVDRRAAGFAGMKDKDAVTTQRISLPDVDPARVLALAGRWPDLEVLEAERHRNKLKPGHLRGNRFRIRLKGIAPDALDAVEASLARIRAQGFPNAFGPQRFGRDGDNAARALAFVRGEARAPRDARERRLLFSALQSRWFNRVLEARVADGTWNTALVGDLLKKTDTGGMFLCTDPETDRARAARGEVSPTGPMFGVEMARPGEDVRARELSVLAADGITEEQLAAQRSLGEGTRRPLRVLVDELAVSRTPSPMAAGELEVRLTLGKGVYATTALATAVELCGPARPAPSDRGTAAPEGPLLASKAGPLATERGQGHPRWVDTEPGSNQVASSRTEDETDG
jgi:tRNA pseudouridine13 synthase